MHQPAAGVAYMTYDPWHIHTTHVPNTILTSPHFAHFPFPVLVAHHTKQGFGLGLWALYMHYTCHYIYT